MRKRIGLMAVIVVLFFSVGHTPAQGDDKRGAYLNVLTGSGWTGVFNTFSQGRKHSRFIKLAIMPDYIQLFCFREGQWTSWKGERQTAVLAREQASKPLWHSVTVKLDNAKRLLTVSGVRQWSCELPEIVPIAETRCGVGVHNGTARFRNWTIK